MFIPLTINIVMLSFVSSFRTEVRCTTEPSPMESKVVSADERFFSNKRLTWVGSQLNIKVRRKFVAEKGHLVNSEFKYKIAVEKGHLL